MRVEWQEVKKAYFEIQDFPETFKKRYGVNLEVFADIMVELLTKCYNSNEHTVVLWSLLDLINNRLLAKKFFPEDIKQVIDILSSDKKRKTETIHFVLRRFYFNKF
ncbi:hypothetical protein IMZ68_04455 [Candidatus Bathyarchaeota archaeon]|nr:hypothetical protein [Candidatus Bathyarchaeota archaeon]